MYDGQTLASGFHNQWQHCQKWQTKGRRICSNTQGAPACSEYEGRPPGARLWSNAGAAAAEGIHTSTHLCQWWQGGRRRVKKTWKWDLKQGCKFTFMTKAARGKCRRERTRRGGQNNLSGLIQNGAQWHFGVIQISAHLGPNESKQPLF